MDTSQEALATKLRATFESMDTLPRRMRQMAAHCRIPERDGLSEELQGQNRAHNDAVAEFVERCNASEEDLRQAIERAGDSDEIGDVLTLCENVRTDGPYLGQEMVRLFTRKVELARAAIDELRQIPKQLEADAEKIVAKVKSDLEKIGSGVAAQPAMSTGSTHLTIAERQFDTLARTVNTRSRAALLAVKVAHAEVQAAYETSGGALRGLEEAKASLLKIARKALAG